jgi:hypothetical protein
MSSPSSITTTVQGGSSPVEMSLDVSQPITLDLGLGDIGISLLGSASSPITLGPVTLDLQPLTVNPVTLNLGLTGNPSEPVAVELGMNVHVDPLDLKLEPLTITLTPLKIDLGLDNINVCLSLAVTQFPRMRLHMPKQYDYGFGLFGVPIVNFSICGESSFITEDNPPRVFRTTHADDPRPPPADSPRDSPFRIILS